MFNAENTVLVIIDAQEKLFRVMYEKEVLSSNIQKLIKGIQAMGVPVILTEQNPAGLGATIPEISNILSSEVHPVPKFNFSAWGEENFRRKLEELQRKQVLLTGIENHICVYQTAIDLLGSGYEVQVVSDCVSSRTPENRDLGLKRMNMEGVRLTSTEMILFELLKSAKDEKFKTISSIVK
jgi:nicotinamidase-related amidase